MDEPLVAASTQYLDSGTWGLTNNQSTFPAKIPGDIVTDLETSGAIGDPLYERNFKSLLWDATAWTVTREFDAAPSVMALPTRWLVLDGVKMGAWVWFNGQFLGTTADQFLRYTFDVSATVKSTGNMLQLTFPPSNHSLNDEARWMAC